MDRPDEFFCNGRYAVLNFLCCAELLRFCYLAIKVEDNDWQREELKDDILKKNVSE